MSSAFLASAACTASSNWVIVWVDFEFDFLDKLSVLSFRLSVFSVFQISCPLLLSRFESGFAL